MANKNLEALSARRHELLNVVKESREELDRSLKLVEIIEKAFVCEVQAQPLRTMALPMLLWS